MISIYIKVVCHRLAINPSIKPISQIKRKVDKEKRTTIDKDFEKLTSVSYIMNGKYLLWLANMVFVRKT